jgi:hypothetical protein
MHMHKALFVYPGDAPATAGGDVMLILGRDLRGMITQTRFQRPGKLLQAPIGGNAVSWVCRPCTNGSTRIRIVAESDASHVPNEESCKLL